MDESSFLALMMRARRFSALGERTDYWHGYQRGLRRGFHGDLFGTEAEHKRWIGLADDGVDKASRERGRGYRDGLNTCRRLGVTAVPRERATKLIAEWATAIVAGRLLPPIKH